VAASHETEQSGAGMSHPAAHAPPPQPKAERHSLDAFFAPRAVAVIGASDKPHSVGRSVLWNLISSPFGGTVYAINPRRVNVLGIQAYKSIGALPEMVDLAMVLTPAATVPGIIQECIDAGVKGAIIISAGFRETGEAGRELEDQIRQEIQPEKIRVIGPNSLGLMNPVSGLNAAFASRIARKGTVGFISQSGALGAAILDWSLRVKVGFSAFVSFGSMVDVSWADLLFYLREDPNTKSIVLYMQSVGDARSFLSAAREVALTKPIILLKAGQTERAARVAERTPYYSAADACSDEVLAAAFRRSGILRVDDIESLFSLADVLGKQPRPKGPRLTIVSNAAGPGILATDALVSGGGQLADLSETTMSSLNQMLPGYWNRANPIDILADASPERYAQAVEIAAQDENTDGLLVVLTPQVMTDATRTAERLAALENYRGKPVLASWMGGADVAAGASILNSCNMPVFPYPDKAAQVFNAMWRYSYNLRGLYETPEPDTEKGRRDRAAARRIIESALAGRQTRLSECASKKLLAASGLPVVETRVAYSEEGAVGIAESIGYPVVLTWDSPQLPRERGRGSVHLNLANEAAVRRAYRALQAGAPADEAPGAPKCVIVRAMVETGAYRIVLRSSIDPQFGPYLLFRPGGALGEVYRDRALGLPPLNSTLARRMLEQTRLHAALRGGGGLEPVDLGELEQYLVRFSHLVAEERWIRAIEINPLMATANQIITVDVRVTLHDPDTQVERLPQPAIRPYPREYVTYCTMKNGETVTLRPIRPEDESLMVRFHETLSKDTVYNRFLRLLALDQRVKHERLSRLCFIDYDRAMAIIAVHQVPETAEERILAVTRMVKLHGTSDADFAIIVSDAYHGLGLGTALLQHLARVARDEKVRRLLGVVLPDNRPMLRLCSRIGFTLHKPVGDDVIAELLLA